MHSPDAYPYSLTLPDLLIISSRDIEFVNVMRESFLDGSFITRVREKGTLSPKTIATFETAIERLRSEGL